MLMNAAAEAQLTTGRLRRRRPTTAPQKPRVSLSSGAGARRLKASGLQSFSHAARRRDNRRPSLRVCGGYLNFWWDLA